MKSSACLGVLAMAATQSALAARPNIVFIYSDDQAYWTLGATGNKDVKTPVLDQLCRDGARFTNCFATTPVCSPARVSVMTSRYGTEVGITDWLDPNKEPEVGLDPKFIAWPKVLADGGYATALFGKWHLGLPDKYHPTRHGFQTFVGSRGSPNKLVDAAFEINGKDVKLPGLLTENLTRYVLEYLRQPHEKPFVMCIHYRNPHTPYIPVAEDIWAYYKQITPSLPVYPDLDTDRAGTVMRKYLASVAELDCQVGLILKTLDETHQAANTIVIFSSDQGYNVGHHGLLHKGNAQWILNSTHGKNGPEVQRPNMFDTSLRVPTMIRWPGVIAPGTVINETISGLDWYPTLVAIAGAGLPKDAAIRGHSFLPLLKGEHIPSDNDLYAEYSQHHYTTADLRAYRTPQWKLVRDFRNSGKDELYNLAQDPEESQNLIAAQDAQARKAIAELNQKLIAKMRETNDPVLPAAQARPIGPTQ